MISNYSSSRTLRDNIILGSLTAFTAGAVNVASFMIFFSFTSNVTGYYTILAAEIVKGNFYQVGVVFAWIFLFFLGGFTSNLIIIKMSIRRIYTAHALPIFLEMLLLLTVGLYGEYLYQETLYETEVLLGLLIYAMGIQNGFTASISNFAIKTTHLTGATTDMGILFAMFTQKRFRNNPELKEKASLLGFASLFYMTGAFIAAIAQSYLGFRLFLLICFVLLVVLVYNHSRVQVLKYSLTQKKKKDYKVVNSADIQ